MKWTPIGSLKPDAIDLVPITHVFDRDDNMFVPWVCNFCQQLQLTDHVAAFASHCNEQQTVVYPTLNRLFPLPDPVASTDAHKLGGLPVCLVYVHQWGLAITSYYPRTIRWELAEAYMRLNFLPPYSLIEGGLGDDGTKLPSELNRWILAGAAATTKLIGKRADTTASILNRERSRLFERTVRR